MIPPKFVVSGASGWLGREFVFYLLRNGAAKSLSEFKLYSSIPKVINFEEFGVLKTESFLEADPGALEGADCFVHLAFLTRDLEKQYGQSQYVATNISLTEKALALISSAKPKRVVNVSSGAIFDRATGELESSLTNNPYGYLKLQEEVKLTEACRKSDSSLAIGRLWGCSGEFMPINRAYALSDLIYTALTVKRMTIKSRGNVWRRYCDAGEFMYLLYLISNKYDFKTIDSGGPVVEIGELTALISDQCGGIEISREKDLGAKSDDYYPRTNDFEEMTHAFRFPTSSKAKQVSQTIKGHRKALSTLE